MAPASSSSAASGATSSAALPKKKSQPSRKTKAAWRKNIDLSEIDASLEAKRTAERAFGMGASADVSRSTDAALFVEDREGDEGARKRVKKPLRSLQVLEKDSAVAPITSKPRAGIKQSGVHAKQRSRADEAGLSKKMKDRLRRIAGKDVKGPFGAIEDDEGRVNKLAQDRAAEMDEASYDVWGGKEAKGKKQKASILDDEWVDDKRTMIVKPPATIATAAPLKSIYPAVSLPLEGQSYNPPAAAHDELLSAAERSLALSEAKRAKELAFADEWKKGALTASEREGRSAEEGFLMGMKVGQLDDDDDEEQEDSQGESTDEETRKARAEPKRKTKAQRARAQRAKEEAAAAAARKASRRLLANLPSHKALSKQERQRAAQRAAKASVVEARRKVAGHRGERVGKFKLPNEGIFGVVDSVQLGEDLSEGLRSLKTEGNLFRDRFESLAARGLVEPRQRAIPKKGGIKNNGADVVGRGKKVYDSHSWKRD